MNNNEFKILTISSIYVDFVMLGNGIYETSIPRLFDVDTTMESLIESYKKLVNQNFINNLQKCNLETITLTLKK